MMGLALALLVSATPYPEKASKRDICLTHRGVWVGNENVCRRPDEVPCKSARFRLLSQGCPGKATKK